MAKSLSNEELNDLRQGVGSFGCAIKALKEGKKVTRLGWSNKLFNNPHVWLELQVPDENSKMTLPYIYMVKAEDKFPCDLSCESYMAEDWTVIENTVSEEEVKASLE